MRPHQYEAWPTMVASANDHAFAHRVISNSLLGSHARSRTRDAPNHYAKSNPKTGPKGKVCYQLRNIEAVGEGIVPEAERPSNSAYDDVGENGLHDPMIAIAFTVAIRQDDLLLVRQTPSVKLRANQTQCKPSELH